MNTKDVNVDLGSDQPSPFTLEDMMIGSHRKAEPVKVPQINAVICMRAATTGQLKKFGENQDVADDIGSQFNSIRDLLATCLCHTDTKEPIGMDKATQLVEGSTPAEITAICDALVNFSQNIGDDLGNELTSEKSSSVESQLPAEEALVSSSDGVNQTSDDLDATTSMSHLDSSEQKPDTAN